MIRNSHPDVIRCVEHIHLPSLYQVINGPDEQSALDPLLDKVKPLPGGEYGRVEHDWKKGRGSPFGRYYSPGSLIRQKRVVRALLAGRNYTELDLRASNPTLLYNVMQYYHQSVPVLKQFVSARDDCETEMLSELPLSFGNLVVDGEPFTMKRFVNSAINGSQQLWRLMRPHVPERGLIASLKRELDYALNFVNTQFAHVPVGNHCMNAEGSRMTNVLLTLECDVMISVLKALETASVIAKVDGRYAVGLAYDGLLLETVSPVHTQRAAAIANAAIEQMGYKYLVVRCKSLETPSPHAFPVRADAHAYFSGLEQYSEEKLFVRSPTGSGKTSHSVRYAMNHFRRVLVIVHRQMLALDLKQKYPRFGCYLRSNDDRATLDNDLQIVCLNSLDKLKDPRKYECVICDEVSSVMWQLVEMRVSNVSIELFGAYATAPGVKFIGLDALLCRQDVDFWRAEFEERELSPAAMRFVTPDALSPVTQQCALYDDMHALKVDLITSVAAGKRVCVAYSTSIDKMNGLLTSLGEPFLNVNRYTKDTCAVADWSKYDVVAFSPTMDAGVDVSFTNERGERIQHFDVVYGVFNASNTTPKQAVQMMGRVRDCSDYRLCVTGHVTDKLFRSQAEFHEYVTARLDCIAHFGFDLSLNNDFSASVANNFRYRLTYNSVAHKRESEHYIRYVRKYLIMNQWALVAPDAQDVDDGYDIKGAEEDGVLAEMKAIAEARIKDCSDWSRENLIEEMHREYVAWSVNRAFGLDQHRPPCPGSVFDDDVSINDVHTWRDTIQQKQLRDLYPFDETGKAIGFNYLGEFRRSRDVYFRALQLLALERDQETPFTFVLQRQTFKEITLQVRMLLRELGFRELGAQVASVPYERLRTLQHARIILQGTNVTRFLKDHAGLTIEQHDGAFVLCSVYISQDPDTEGAYYIADSPFRYTGCNEASARGSQFRCTVCDRRLSRYNARDHECPALPAGIEYVRFAGRVRKYCTVCDEVVERNLKRHCERRH